MKINKYTPPERLKAEVMAKITEDGYADELLSLPGTSKKRTRIIPLLSAAAAVALVVCASVYVLGLGGIKKADEGTLTDEESAVGATEDFSESDSDGLFDMIEEGDVNQSETSMPENSSGTNDNAFVPDSTTKGDEAQKNDAITATVTVNGKTVPLTPADSYDILKLLKNGESIESDCSCTPRYTIQIGEKCYIIHEECGNVEYGHGILRGISITALDEIVKKYIDIG